MERNLEYYLAELEEKDKIMVSAWCENEKAYEKFREAQAEFLRVRKNYVNFCKRHQIFPEWKPTRI